MADEEEFKCILSEAKETIEHQAVTIAHLEGERAKMEGEILSMKDFQE